MQPVIVLPMNDPAGLMFPHLKAITPQLKKTFARAFVSVPLATREKYPAAVAWLGTDDFFQSVLHETHVTVGQDFLALYSAAARACPPEQILHLGFIDRVAFALQSAHAEAFLADVASLRPAAMPLIFQRSRAAWATHPDNYHTIESMATQVGSFLFGEEYDFGWCHLALQAGQLGRVLPSMRSRDLSVVAELVLLLRREFEIHARDVDWLAWEDPFILSRDPGELKAEREGSPDEVRKRLSYVIPTLQLLDAAAAGNGK